MPATLITSLGNNIQLIAAALLVVRTEKSMLAVGWLFIAVAIPQAVLSPFFGRLADRFDRRMLWFGCDMTSAAAALALPVALAFGGPRGTLIYLSNFALAVISALFVPASTGLIKERVRPTELRRFNANYEMATQAGMLASASVGGFAVQYFGASPLFVFNAATFLASAVCVLAMGGSRHRAEPVPSRRGEPVPAVDRPPLARLILLYAQGNVVVTVFNALLPVFVIAEMHRGAGVLGIVDALGGAGFLFAALVYKLLTRKARSDLRIALAGFLLCNVTLVLQPWFGVAGLVCFVPIGALLFGQARIASRTLLMSSVPEARIGAAFGVANGCGLAATVVVMLVVSTVTDHSGTRYGFATLAAVSTAAAVAAGGLLIRRRQPPAAVPSVQVEPHVG